MSDAPSRVAVIAIHGVGYHESGASAEAVTDLLEAVKEAPDPNARHRYASFAPHEVQITLPPPIRTKKIERRFQFSFNAMEERRGEFEKLSHWKAWFLRGKDSAAKPVVPDIATEYMDTQLEDFIGDPLQSSYTTWRREGRRAAQGTQPAKDVDVYDMHWADLARPSNSLLRFLFSFYQLLLHLVSLGRIALDHAAYENFGDPFWFLFLRSYTYATRILTLFIVQLTVIIFGVAISPLPLWLDVKVAGPVVATIGIGVAGALLVLWRGQGTKQNVLAKSWWYWVILALAVGIAVGVLLQRFPAGTPAVLLTEWWVVTAIICILIFWQYDLVRSGSREVGTVLTLLVTATLLILILREHSLAPVALRTAVFYLIQYVFLALRFLWVLFFVLVAFAFAMEGICRLRLSKDKQKLARVRAAARTARFAIALPSLLILLLAVFTGSAVYQFLSTRAVLYEGVVPQRAPLFEWLQGAALDSAETEKLLEQVKKDPPKPTDSCGPAAQCMPDKNDGGICKAAARAVKTASEDPNRFLEGLVYQSAPLGMPLSLGLAGLGFFLLVLIVLPSVLDEISAPGAEPNGPSRNLGHWLSAGYRNFHWVILILWFAAFAVPLGFMAYGGWKYLRAGSNESFLLFLYQLPGTPQAAKALLTWGGVLVGSGAVLLGLIVKNFSAVLDAILDVDTYLRTSPLEATPRARIVERYVALLGHIHSRRNKDGTHYYEKVVIVAHSLGSNITADMLRFMNKCADPNQKNPDSKLYEDYLKFAFAGEPQGKLPIYFFSMGCPLRQLLNRFFPHLYKWIREVPEDSGISTNAMKPGDPIPPNTPPLAAELRAKRWVNLYRCGDYIGRSVWSNDVMSRTNGGDDAGAYPETLETNQNAALQESDPDQTDACIGLGAHTHYWDRTAADVGDYLDSLISS